MIHELLASVPKAAAIALGTAAIVGGAVGAAASAGSGDVPGPVDAVFTALGFGLENASDDDSATAVAGKGKHAARATASGTALAGTTLGAEDLPSKSSIPGLCRAYASGSDNGRERKLEAMAFKRLQNAADAAGAEDLEDYCEDVLEARTARKATAVATGTATSRATQDREHDRSRSRSSDDGERSHGKSEDHRPAYSPAATSSGREHGADLRRNSAVPRATGAPSTDSQDDDHDDADRALKGEPSRRR